MKKTIILLVVMSLLFSGCAQIADHSSANAPQGYALEKIGMKYEGAEIVESEYVNAKRSGATAPYHTVVGQSMINYYIPEKADKTPILMLPGHGLSGYMFISTPDGRNGWAWDFAKAGYPVYVQTPAVQAMSGMDIKPFQDVKNGKADIGVLPEISHYSNEIAWKLWGFGEAMDKPYKDTQYPVKDVIQFYSSYSPMIEKSQAVNGEAAKGKAKNGAAAKTKGNARFSADQDEVDNMIELLEETGPAIVLAHSMAGTLATAITEARPDLVKAVVLIEPVGTPTDEAVIKKYYAKKPYLAVYGDYVESRGQTGRLEDCKTTADLVNKNGGTGEVIELTKLGIKGNTHIMSQDKNSAYISGMINEWLGKK